MKRFLTKFLLLIILTSLIVSNGCGGGRSGGKTYDRDMEGVMRLYRGLRFATAYKAMGRKAGYIMKKVRADRYLAFLELGKIALASQNYKYAIKYATIAERRFLNISGTISLNEESSAIFLDDTGKEYMPEPHEMIMISPYLALNYAAKGDYRGASVERNRAINRISEYIERTNKRYLENAFARYLSAVLYERDRKIQDARLEYRKIVKYSPYSGDAREALSKLGKIKRGNGNLVCFIDIGMSPVKRQRIFNKKIRTRNGVVQVKFAYAVMKRSRWNRIHSARILVDGEEIGESHMLYNVEKIVMKQFKKNHKKIRNGILKRVLPRVISQVAGQALQRSDNTGVKIIGALINIGAKISMAIERADTRSWLSLPRFIHVLSNREIPTGEHKLQIVYLNRNGSRIGQSPERTINIQRDGDFVVQHFAAPY